MQFPRPRLSYANVASTLALVLATSMGGAYAHGKIGSADIKKNAVKSRHIASGQVKTPDIRNGAVTLGKLAPNARARIIEYSLGPNDFTETPEWCVSLPGLTPEAVRASVWSAQLDRTYAAGGPTPDVVSYSVPGAAEFGVSAYRVWAMAGSSGYHLACVSLMPGEVGEDVDVDVRIIRTLPNQRQSVPGGPPQP